MKILPIRGPTTEEALAFLDKVDLRKADDDDSTRAKLALVAELVGDRFTSLKTLAAMARMDTVTERGARAAQGDPHATCTCLSLRASSCGIAERAPRPNGM